MAAGAIKEIAYGADLEVLRHGGTQYVEQATQVHYVGAPIVRNSSGLVGECGAAFTRVDAIATRAGQNGAASGLITEGIPVSTDRIFEATLIQAWNQNLALPGVYYGLTRTAIPGVYLPDGVTQAYAHLVDTTNTAPHVEIIGLAGPADNQLAGGWAAGDTYVRVLIRFSPGVSQGAASGGLASVANTITAFATGGQTNATALTATYNRVTVAATLGDSVRLPTSVAGRAVTIDNQGAQPIRVFGAGTDTINGVATATGVSQAPGKITTYYATVAGNWESATDGAATISRVANATVGAKAIDPDTPADYLITAAGVATMTLAAPTRDGIVISFISNTTNAHTLTATGLFGTGAAAVNLATFAAFLGAGLTVESKTGKWLCRAPLGITFS